MKKRDTKISLVVLINFFPTQFSDASRSRNVLGTFFHKRTLINTLFSLLFIMFLLPVFFVGAAGASEKAFCLNVVEETKRQKAFPAKQNENKNKRVEAIFLRIAPHTHHSSFLIHSGSPSS